MTTLLHKPNALSKSVHEGRRGRQIYEKNQPTWFLDVPMRWIKRKLVLCQSIFCLAVKAKTSIDRKIKVKRSNLRQSALDRIETDYQQQMCVHP